MALRILSIALLMLSLALPAAGQSDLVSISAQASPAAIKPGQSARLTVTVKVADKFHINSNAPKQAEFIPTVLEISGGDGLKLGQAKFPKPQAKKVSFAPEQVELFGGSFDIVLDIAAPDGAKAGKRSLKALLSYQACDDEMCMMPAAAEASAELEVK
jgi:thiol:disulfide interchange protein DsbD